jgi:hypothetical protein
MSYDEAILKIAISEGIKEEIIETALITMGKADELKFDIRKFMQSKLGNVNIGYSAEVSLNPIDNETEEVDMVFSI